MMNEIISLLASDGTTVRFYNEVKASGGMKDVYFSPDRSYVVAFFRDRNNAATKERLAMITGQYRERIFNQPNGDYWRSLYCWPTATVEHQGRLGVVVPFYASNFFFEHGSQQNDMLGIKGKEKEGKWFASPSNRQRFLDARELGDWLNHLKICLMIARSVRRLHAAGLAHSDLSYKNVLVDPVTGRACLIDLDGLVVPNKFPPDVVGTPDFIAPECVKTARLDKHDPKRVLPSIRTDQHALAVLIYMYLLYRHPLRGDKVHDAKDSQHDEELAMGEHALFVEHPTEHSNRINPEHAKPSELPWKDTAKTPYILTGSYLAPLFERAFIDGLHQPHLRPTADEWEHVLVKTVDLIQPCQNPQCTQKWYVFDNKTKPKCPFCGTPFHGKLPVLNLYSSHQEGRFLPDNHRLMVYSNQSLFLWHVNRTIFPNERLTPEQKKRVGYFVFHQNVWWLVNEGMSDLMDTDSKEQFAIGSKVELKEGRKLLLARGEGGRLVVVQMVECVS